MESTGQGAGHAGDVSPEIAADATNDTPHLAETEQGATNDTPAAPPEPVTAAARSRKTRRETKNRPKATQEEIRRRVTYVLQLYVNGYGHADILRRVAAAHAREAAKRKEWQQNADNADAPLPSFVWGTSDEPFPTRTIEYYITAAKRELEKGGAAVARLGDRLMGMQLARINKTWRVALKDRRPASMARVIELTNEMFAFDGAIRPALTALAPTGERVGEHEPPPDASQTEVGAADELASLLALGQQRRAAALAAQTTLH